ncbi:hypothetical protein DID76_04255 [Candidatus Marinamargulisbacteria bacterium SCGC AG-414-C22]|nr:hypothetical protein DID76_04255 [Candidatus Marinamargulisbacteria bacterium SCGC AG-414-C22]
MKNYKEVHVHRQMHISHASKIPHSNNTDILLASVKHELRPLFDASIKKFYIPIKDFQVQKANCLHLFF